MSQKTLNNEAPTPMLRQYMSIKEEHPDSILLFRLGDFYEMFYDDAVLAANILDITLTTRNKNDPNPVPLCGVPHHSVEPYIGKLLESGKKVAICDQVEDPKKAKGIVKRAVTRVLTPGVVPDGLGLNSSTNNYLVSLYKEGDLIGFAAADVSTGLFQTTELLTDEQLIEEFIRLEPKEAILKIPNEEREKISLKLKGIFQNVLFTDWKGRGEDESLYDIEGGAEIIEKYPAAANAARNLLSYISSMQGGSVGQMTRISSYSTTGVMRLDESTVRNLELIKTMREGTKEGSLLQSIDRTKTSQGARKLKRWLLYPLTDVEAIEQRLSAVDTFLKLHELSEKVDKALSEIYDLERISGRLGASAANARDMVALRNSLLAVKELKTLLDGSEGLLSFIRDSICSFTELVSEIDRTILDDPPISIREGGVIKGGVSKPLDELRDIIANGKNYIAAIESKERERTGITSLKIKFNKVFGYYIEVTNAHKSKVPEDYIRKQTLTNAERYITPELKEYEERVLGAEEKVRALEYEIFTTLRDRVAGETALLQKTADAVASIDVLLSFAKIASESDFCRPQIDESRDIEITDGRHLIIEKLNPLERFVPNDVSMNEKSRFMMITGPNMAGKSTVMRQTALIALISQVGSFVPAKKARIGIVDRIFTRVGASDALSKGQSTFMLEMAEAAVILKDATDRSLVIIDEIGRGTSTFDGLAIAWAVAEDLHDRVCARTMFATHYHELTDLSATRQGIANMQIAVKEWEDSIVFLRKLVPGGTSRSYGIQVAKLAGLPQEVVMRAGEILQNLEEEEFDEVGRPRIAVHHEANEKPATGQYQLFTRTIPDELLNRLQEIDTSVMTPIEALNILHELKQKI